MPTVALFFTCYGLAGMYGAYAKHEHVLTAYGGLTLLSFVLRLVNWILIEIHSIALDKLHYMFLVVEPILVILVVLMLRS